MPTYKYRDLDEADQALWNYNPGSDYFREINELFSMSEKLNPPACYRGLWKFKTFEEARQHRLETELENALKL